METLVMNWLRTIRLAALLIACTLCVTRAACGETSAAAPVRPNILWFVVDDMSANFSCYGEKLIETPNVDRLAREGVRFTNAFVTAPVCSPCRSALITGMYQTTIGAHHHRSGRGVEKIHLPKGVQPIPALLQEAGYYTCIGSGLRGVKPHDRGAGRGKTDYNFEWDRSIYDSADWSGRAKGQPFFMQVQLPGGKMRGNKDEGARLLLNRARSEFGDAVDPSEVTLPPYYPRHEVLLRDWAAYLESVRFTDRHVGQVLDRLQQEGELENTLIVFMTDHGISHARGKQFLYNEGTHIPFVVRFPATSPRRPPAPNPGSTRTDLIEHIDLAAITLAAAGLPLPQSMQARNVLAADYQPRDAVFAARDRCDETVERIRSVRTDRYLYILNFYPQRPHLQPNVYKDSKSIVQTLRALHAAGELEPLAEELLFSPTRPAEELYDWQADPWQINNLAKDPAHAGELENLRDRLDRWMTETADRGPESDAMYDSDMAVYLNESADRKPNIALMKKWAAEGK
jgi:arylsulfatase A-like enzyme